MNIRIQESLKYFRRDAMAGSVTGAMAIPLTVGICLMSDYPVMTGLYTVIFAGIVSFVTYLLRPGNYTGTPGVAAGLAPALALGIETFGMENMPFVILITSLIQALAWRFRWERYILQLVPHYLVEGLLAGVGLKIALKFVPFLYDISHETETWLNFEREIIIALSLISFGLFVLLYKYYKRKMPALPYFVIMGSGTALSFFMPLKMVSFEQIPFTLALPLPHFSEAGPSENIILALKAFGFALMLASIDIIEQVMSNVAIEKMDPFKRKADTNNSLLAIWVANFGAAFFGGMTNLDGLAKGTTNTVAGAVTKLSNLFTSLVLLLVVLFPVVLDHLPEYALGIIMVYSGWKMIANIEHVRSEGRYALIMAAICGLLVFEMGIFEGLLLLLFAHGIIQYIFMKRVGRSNREIIMSFRDSFNPNLNQEAMELEDMIQEPLVPLLDKWFKAVNAHDLKALMKLYDENVVMVPAFSSKIRVEKEEVSNLFAGLFQKDDLRVIRIKVNSQKVNGLKVDSGQYAVKWTTQGFETSNMLRFSFVIKNGRIITQHSSKEPENETLGAQVYDFVE